jgi:hypothetical protein
MQNPFARIFKRGAKPPFGSVMPQAADLETRLVRLYAQLSQVEELRELQNVGAWKQMRGILLTRILECEREIVSYSGDPDTNRLALITTSAERDTLAAVVAVQDNLPEQVGRLKIEIEKRLDLLKSTVDLPRPSENEDAPGDEPPSL